MVIDRVGEINDVLVLGGKMEPKNISVILGLFLQIGHFVAGVRDLANPDHVYLPRFDFFAAFFLAVLDFDFRFFGAALAFFLAFPRGMLAITSTMTALSCRPRPMSMQRS